MRLGQFKSILLICFLLVLFIGCSSVPSSDDAKQIIQERINKDSGGRIKLVSFQKMNGQEGNLLGFKVYNLEYQMEIEFVEDCKWITGHSAALGGEVGFRTSKPKGSQEFWDKFMDDSTNPGKLVKKGHKERISGSIAFEKTDNGWRVAKF